jgi:hypothetical protein
MIQSRDMHSLLLCMLTFKVRERFVTRNASMYRRLSLYAFLYKHDRAAEVFAHKLMQYKYLSCSVLPTPHHFFHLSVLYF